MPDNEENIGFISMKKFIELRQISPRFAYGLVKQRGFPAFQLTKNPCSKWIINYEVFVEEWLPNNEEEYLTLRRELSRAEYNARKKKGKKNGKTKNDVITPGV